MNNTSDNRPSVWHKGILIGWLGVLFFFGTAVDSPPTESCCLEEPQEEVVFNPTFARLNLGTDKNFDVRLKSGRKATFSLRGFTGYFVRTVNVVSSLNNVTVFMKKVDEISQKAQNEIVEWYAMSEAERGEWYEMVGTAVLLQMLFARMAIGIYPPTDNVITVTADYPALDDKPSGTTSGRVIVEARVHPDDFKN